jgi:uncharacterized protein
MDLLLMMVYLLAALPGIRSVARRVRGRPGAGLGGVWFSAGVLLLLILGQRALGIYCDVLWFREMGAVHRYWTELLARWTTFLVGTAAAFVVLWVNSLFVPRSGSWRPAPSQGGGQKPDDLGFLDLGDGRWALTDVRANLNRAIDRFRLPIILLLSLILGSAFGANWWTILLWLHRQPFHRLDPQFGRDLGFYVFTLPLWNAIVSWLSGVFVVAFLLVMVLRILSFALAGTAIRAWSAPMQRGARHLGILTSLLFFLGAIHIWIVRWELVYSRNGPLVGAAAADVRVGAPLLQVYALTLVLLGIAAAILAPHFRRRLLLGFAVAWLGSAALELIVIPASYEALAVKPEQLRAELPYVKRHLEMTREAFGLDSTHVRVTSLPESEDLTAADLQSQGPTIRNLRLADWRPLLHTYNQLQTLRTYYRFADVDIDRYTVGGEERAVMLSLRELDTSKVPAAAGSEGWDINRWFIYTHGYGLCMNSINSFSAEGIPDLLIRDLPPVSEVPGQQVTRPEIYYGELTTAPVMVRARGQQEFDYPRGDDNIFTTYQGQGGIRLGTVLSARRLAFALRFHMAKFFLSSYIGPETRILMTRDVGSRLARLAPFLTPDQDPYAVLRDDGSLALLRDYYTTWSKYPYGAVHDGVAYIRNSVKATLDCYNGTVRFYVVDDKDPLIRAYRAIFPDLFTDGAVVPDDIRRHFRYPQDLISLQASVYGSFHVRDAVTFYNHEDVWETSTEVLEGAPGGTTVPVLPYYVLMRLPGQPGQEFLQILPLTPRDKDNMIAWIAGRCDPENYGQLAAFHLPKGTIAYGPRQIEARVDQDPTISKDLSLWNQQGSQVLRGNLLTVPIGSSFLYVEPLYIQATGGKIPELKRVIVATQKDVGYGSTLAEALGDLFGPEVAALAPAAEGVTSLNAPGAPAVTTGSSTAASSSTTPAEATGKASPGTETATVQTAAEHLRKYQKLMGEGKAAEAGVELDRLARDLDALARRRPASR